MAPFEEIVNVPLPTDDAPRMVALLLVSATSCAPLLFNVTAPVKLLLAVSSVIAFAPPLREAVRATVAVPESVIAPAVEVTPRVPVAVVVPKSIPPTPSTRVTFLPLALTVPKLLVAVFSVMSAAGAVNVVTPVTATTPEPVIAPSVEATFRVPVAVILPKSIPPVPSTRVTLPPLALTVPKLLVAAVNEKLPGPVRVSVLPAALKTPPENVLPLASLSPLSALRVTVRLPRSTLSVAASVPPPRLILPEPVPAAVARESVPALIVVMPV